MPSSTRNEINVTEKELILSIVDPAIFCGTNNSNIQLLKVLFPSLKITSRGNTIKLSGNKEDVTSFIKKSKLIEQHINEYGSIKSETITKLVKGNNIVSKKSDNLILFGQNGHPISARTENQRKLVDEFKKNDLMFAVGPAGSGKTYTSIALAVKALKEKQVRRIILSRPAVEAGEKLGFLPGGMKEKIDPYLQPLYDALEDMLPPYKLQEYLENNIIQIAPLAFMRGRTLSDAVIILDEAQNTSINQIKMFLTRLGFNSKMIIAGDITQIDLPKAQKSGLIHSLETLKEVKGVSTILFEKKDIIRHELVGRIVEAYEKK